MVSVFAIFATLSMMEMKMMGVGLSAAILLDATLIRLVMLPAILVLLGERAWWPSRPAAGRGSRSWRPSRRTSWPAARPVRLSNASTRTGTPLNAALPDTSRRSGSVRSLIETPATFEALRIRVPSTWWP